MLGHSHRGPKQEQLFSTSKKREHIEPGVMRVRLGLRQSKLQELISYFSCAPLFRDLLYLHPLDYLMVFWEWLSWNLEKNCRIKS